MVDIVNSDSPLPAGSVSGKGILKNYFYADQSVQISFALIPIQVLGCEGHYADHNSDYDNNDGEK